MAFDTITSESQLHSVLRKDLEVRVEALESEMRGLKRLLIDRRLDYIERKLKMVPKDYVRDYTEDDEYLPPCQR